MITEVLADLDPVMPGVNRIEAVDLLIGTAAHESTIGGETHFYQVSGPARGIFQIEPATALDVIRNYIAFRESLVDWFMDRWINLAVDDWKLAYDLRFQIVMARLIYWRSNFDWPEPPNVEHSAPPTRYIRELGEIWKEHYNTHLGKGTVEQFVEDYP